MPPGSARFTPSANVFWRNIFICSISTPTLPLLIPDQQELLKSDAVVQTLEEAWSEPVLAQGISILLTGQSLYGAKGFSRQILALADFLESIPQPQRFFGAWRSFVHRGRRRPIGTASAGSSFRGSVKFLRQARQKIDYARLLHDSIGLGGWLGVNL